MDETVSRGFPLIAATSEFEQSVDGVLRGFLLVALITVVMFVASGAYSLYPGLLYSIILAFSVLAVTMVVTNEGTLVLDQEIGIGVSILLISYFIFFVHNSGAARDAFLLFASLFLFFFAYIYFRNEVDRAPDALSVIVILASVFTLLAMLGFQYLEATGAIESSRLDGEISETGLWRRPGGFHNPNMTASIALVIAYAGIACAKIRDRGKFAQCLILIVCATIIAITQSRAGLISLTILACYTLSVRALLVSGVIALIALFEFGLYEGSPLQVLFDLLGGRFSVESAASDRAFLLSSAVEFINERPLVGHGLGYVQSRLGQGSHNMFVEMWVSGGIIMMAAFCAALLFIYRKAGTVFILVCLVPSLIFSHNFLGTPALQFSLGMALAISIKQTYSAAQSNV